MMDFEAIQLAADKAALREWMLEIRSEQAAELGVELLGAEGAVRMLDFASLLERTIARL